MNQFTLLSFSLFSSRDEPGLRTRLGLGKLGPSCPVRFRSSRDPQRWGRRISRRSARQSWEDKVSICLRMKENRYLTLKVLQPTLSGQTERSETLSPLTPWTLRRSSSTPCFTIEFPSLGPILQVPRECHVVSTWRWTNRLISAVVPVK